jgi:putative acetyltransferase
VTLNSRNLVHGMAVRGGSLTIVHGDFEDARVVALLREHLDGMHANSPPGSVYALDLSGLKTPDIAFFAAWCEGEVLGCAALKHLDASSGEIKSMRTTAAHLRKGVASRLLEHLLTLARSRGYRRVSLETGSGQAFEPALALYRRYGFENGEPFGEYAATDFNQFLHLEL